MDTHNKIYDEEMFDVVNELGIPTGEIISRREAHKKGIRHRTSHLWIFRKHEGKLQVMLQKRCMDKDSFPGYYDISSAGHIPAGEDYQVSAIRELDEELGIKINAQELIYCGRLSDSYEQIFHGEWFRDNQVSNIYLLWKDIEAKDIVFQKSEIEKVIWVNFLKCLDNVRFGRILSCIRIQELELLQEYLSYTKDYI